MSKTKISRWIYVWQKGSEDLVDEIALDSVPLELLRDIFNTEDNDPKMVCDHEIEVRHAKRLEEVLGIKFDLDNYIYHVTCAAEYD